MLIGKRIRLILTEEQEVLFRKSCGVARWSYNYCLSRKQEIYNKWKENNSNPKNISEGDIRKEITQLKRLEEYSWLKEVGSNTIKQAVKDADEAYQRFFSGLSKYSKFKSKHKSKMSFYTNYESCIIKDKYLIQCEKLGIIKTSEEIPELKEFKLVEKFNKKTNEVEIKEVECYYLNPRISYDGRFWYLSFSYEELELKNYNPEVIKLINNSLGIDLGLKDLVIVSNQNNTYSKKFKNINKSKEIKRLEKKLKRCQRKLGRKLLFNTESYIESSVISRKNGKEYLSRKPIYKKELQKCANIQKVKYEISLIYKKLSDIRNNHIHQITNEIVKTKPFQIVMEDLKISNLIRNKHLSKSILDAKWYFIRQCFKYKCKKYGINFILVDRFYPSSKLCSNCHSIKKDLKLKDRIYHCDSCGATIDRDINASINLANYNLK